MRGLRECASALQRTTSLRWKIAECQRLVKGYGDTHERGWRNFTHIMRYIDAGSAPGELAARVRRLRAAALADEDGRELDSALKELAAAA